MSGKTKLLISAAILLLVAFGAAAALASGIDDAGGSNKTAVVDTDGHEIETPDGTESDEMEDADEPADVDGPGDVEDDDIEEVGETNEASHPEDAAEDEVEGPDRPITGPDLERASQVALDYVGGGRVTGTEIEDEESYYEIEVTTDDGSQIDIQLDESFNVVGTD